MHNKGWRYESSRHACAARGIKSGRKSAKRPVKKSISHAVPVYDLEMIAGRGTISTMNWGYGAPTDAQINKWKSELEKEIGKEVMLSGGGGPGLHRALLTEVWIDKRSPGEYGLRVRLANTDPPMMDGKDFTPYMGSWQISRLKKVGTATEKNSKISAHFRI